jgi:UDP-GlcNAc:undecaprenyl-phosphate GlcNAc-1-phosphate transferase
MLGFIDDDPRKAGIRVQGFPVLGGYSALQVLLKAASVDSVIVSARRMTPERMNNLQVLCAEAGIQLSRLQIAIQPILDPDEAPRDARPALHQVKP